MSISKLKSPFAWFGAKSRVAPIIWQGLGDIANYIEPFCGSLAVLLANPKPSKIETVNDIDHFLTNFWRAVSQNPKEVAQHADAPVHEDMLHARQRWLLEQATDEFKLKMNSDPDFYDTKMAGYWVYGQCASIGNNWLQPKGLNATPLLSSAGGGIHGLTADINKDFETLQKRLKRVRITCGNWNRIVTPSITYGSKGLSSKDITGVFLDPPYDLKSRDKVYKEESDVFSEVVKWAIENGDNICMRIVLCGYEGEHQIPDTWQTYAWKTNGGLANLGNDRGKSNRDLERIWFSPHCLKII